jgi:hypothetical protein
MPTLPVCCAIINSTERGAGVSFSGLVRFCGLAAIGAGALLVVADLLSLTISPKGPSVESLTSGAYAVQSVLKLAAAALLLFGLLGLHLTGGGRWQLGHCRLPGGLLWYHAGGRCLLGNCLLCADGGRRRSQMVRGWRRRPPGTASGGFRVFVGGLHSRMGTVWGSGDEGPGLPSCSHHTAHIWCGSRVRLAARRRVSHQHLVQRGYSLAGLCTLDRRGRISRTTLPGEVVSEREALGISVNRGTPPPNFMHTLLAGGYNVGR